MNGLKRAALNWLAALASVWMVASLSAVPVLAAAVVAANSVDSRAIINGQVKTADLGKGVVTAKKIKKGAVRRGKIAKSAVNSAKIKDGSITNTDIAPSAAITDSKIQYLAKTKYLSIPAVSFDPMQNDIVYSKAGNGWLGAYWKLGASTAWFIAPVNLPDGAKIIEFSYDYLDKDDTYYTRAELIASEKGAPTEMSAVESTGPFNSPNWQTASDSTIVQPVIDNQKYNYFARIRLHEVSGSLLLASRVLIKYEVTGP